MQLKGGQSVLKNMKEWYKNIIKEKDRYFYTMISLKNVMYID